METPSTTLVNGTGMNAMPHLAAKDPVDADRVGGDDGQDHDAAVEQELKRGFRRRRVRDRDRIGNHVRPEHHAQAHP